MTTLLEAFANRCLSHVCESCRLCCRLLNAFDPQLPVDLHKLLVRV